MPSRRRPAGDRPGLADAFFQDLPVQRLAVDHGVVLHHIVVLERHRNVEGGAVAVNGTGGDGLQCIGRIHRHAGGTEFFHRHQVHVDGTRADGTAAGQRDLGLPPARE